MNRRRFLLNDLLSKNIKNDIVDFDVILISSPLTSLSTLRPSFFPNEQLLSIISYAPLSNSQNSTLSNLKVPIYFEFTISFLSNSANIWHSVCLPSLLFTLHFFPWVLNSTCWWCFRSVFCEIEESFLYHCFYKKFKFLAVIELFYKYCCSC